MYQLEPGLIHDEHIRRARHAYYGALAYVDDCFGEMVRTLEETGLAENTVVMVIADHGEMLGERDLWYKMNFFENAVRVPFIVHNPRASRPVGSAKASRWWICCLRLSSLPAAKIAKRRLSLRWMATVWCRIYRGYPGRTGR